MNVITKFSDTKDITIDNYLKSCGIKDISEFIKPTDKYIEDWTKLSNIFAGVDLVKKYIVKEGDI